MVLYGGRVEFSPIKFPVFTESVLLNFMHAASHIAFQLFRSSKAAEEYGSAVTTKVFLFGFYGVLVFDEVSYASSKYTCL